MLAARVEVADHDAAADPSPPQRERVSAHVAVAEALTRTLRAKLSTEESEQHGPRVVARFEPHGPRRRSLRTAAVRLDLCALPRTRERPPLGRTEDGRLTESVGEHVGPVDAAGLGTHRPPSVHSGQTRCGIPLPWPVRVTSRAAQVGQYRLIDALRLRASPDGSGDRSVFGSIRSVRRRCGYHDVLFSEDSGGLRGCSVLAHNRAVSVWAHSDLNQGRTGYEPVSLTRLRYRPFSRTETPLRQVGF